MVSIDIVYDGDTKCTLTHESGYEIGTVAPKDIGGDGDKFSPTDLVAAGLASCILTTVAMWAKRHDIDITGASATITKEMATSSPRRIARLATKITIPENIIPEDMREHAEKIAHSCPVHQSLHPDIEAPIEFVYL
jgi:putative redox protein